MKNRLQLRWLWAVGLLLAALTPAAFAQEALDVSLPVVVEIEGTAPEQEETYHSHLEAQMDAPMPSGSEGGVYDLAMEGDGQYTYPEITYQRVGVYHYSLYQHPGENPQCTYDDTVYSLTVYITNSEEGSGLISTVVAQTGEGEKMETVTFHNVYAAPPPPDDDDKPVVPDEPDKPEKKPQPKPPVKTGDEQNATQWQMLLLLCSTVLVLLLVKQKETRVAAARGWVAQEETMAVTCYIPPEEEDEEQDEPEDEPEDKPEDEPKDEPPEQPTPPENEEQPEPTEETEPLVPPEDAPQPEQADQPEPIPEPEQAPEDTPQPPTEL